MGQVLTRSHYNPCSVNSLFLALFVLAIPWDKTQAELTMKKEFR